ncbi:uncharacterized protein IL334_001174 [Kwoniella shivajii]|uniref:GATA-type domain-containing protein n=1 Tax=Kwoniella shivajii TaxID=564305 RepID=A0ABZ1CRT2_9TREE|nr:hypothetical protein IL334_001174 [Kwoniella shivajii]
MSARTSLRSNADFNPITLPSASRPQYVNDEGYEYDPNDIDDDQQGRGKGYGVEGLEEVIEGGEEAEAVDEEVGGDDDEDVIMDDIQVEYQEEQEEEEQEEEEEQKTEPLLSIAESLVLPYSLVQTRIYHRTSLFPHIFSHPVIPSHNKPRARPPPKGTFIFPTPTALIHPLPHTEYHGPLRPHIAESSTSIPVPIPPTVPGESSNSHEHNNPSASTSTPPPTTKGSRTPRSKKTAHAEEVEWPAHEIECISRCTLTVGPISYPGTEIWLGHFVEPRITQAKKERAKPGEKKEKRKLLAQDTMKRAKIKKTGSGAEGETPRRAHPKPSKSKSTPNSSGPVRPPPYVPTHIPRPPIHRLPPGPMTTSVARPIPPAAASTSARPTASPQLIQLVNQAASRHSWLSSLIYKAAGSTANQTELERLGKAVARLSRGEPIDDLAPPPVPPGQAVAGIEPSTAAQARPVTATGGPVVAQSVTNPDSSVSVSATATTGSPAPKPAPPASSSGTTPTTMTPANPPAASTTNAIDTKPDEPDSDDEIDMSGPKQIGGGPLPSDLDHADAPPDSSQTVADLPRPSHSSPPRPSPLSSPVDDGATSITAAPRLPPTHVLSPPSAAADSIITAYPAAVATMPAIVNPLFANESTNTAPNTAYSRPPSVPPFAQPSPSPRLPTPTPPPPVPPKRVHPLPPPFLLVAFKEQPTEKYLIPLGKNSFISRVGGDYVTGPRPPTPEPELQHDLNPESTKIKLETNPSTIPSLSSEPAQIESPLGPVVNPDDVPPAIPLIAGKPLRSRTRQSLGRHVKDLPSQITVLTPPPAEAIPTPIPQPETEPELKEKPKPTSGLPPLPSQSPAAGTVLISTVIPSGIFRWEKVDWEKLGKGIPFDNPEFKDDEISEPTIKEEPKDETSSAIKPSKPLRDLRHPRSNSDIAVEHKSKPRSTNPSLLNLAAEDFMNPQGDIQPVTIRLMGITDEVWKRMKQVVDTVEKNEIEAMVKVEPELLNGLDQETLDDNKRRNQDIPFPSNSAALIDKGEVNQDGLPNGKSPLSITPQLPVALTKSPRLSSKALASLKSVYLSRKTAHFTSLLKRVPPRSFLQTRVAPPRSSELVDATTDKWAPRPYPMSTKPLFVTNDDENDDGNENGDDVRLEIEFSPEPNNGKSNKKKGGDSKVTFEMPVSYDKLDEKIEQGVLQNLNKRKYTRSKKNDKDGDGNVEVKEKKKKKGKRGTQHGICEGCGKENIKVWRRGPTGRGTLCSPCGDLFVAKKLGPLKRPGAMKVLLGEGDGADEEKGDDTMIQVEEEQETQSEHPTPNVDAVEGSSKIPAAADEDKSALSTAKAEEPIEEGDRAPAGAENVPTVPSSIKGNDPTPPLLVNQPNAVSNDFPDPVSVLTTNGSTTDRLDPVNPEKSGTVIESQSSTSVSAEEQITPSSHLGKSGSKSGSGQAVQGDLETGNDFQVHEKMDVDV